MTRSWRARCVTISDSMHRARRSLVRSIRDSLRARSFCWGKWLARHILSPVGSPRSDHRDGRALPADRPAQACAASLSACPCRSNRLVVPISQRLCQPLRVVAARPTRVTPGGCRSLAPSLASNGSLARTIPAITGKIRRKASPIGRSNALNIARTWPTDRLDPERLLLSVTGALRRPAPIPSRSMSPLRCTMDGRRR